MWTRERYRAYHREYAKRRRRENPEARAKERIRNEARRQDPRYKAEARLRTKRWLAGKLSPPRILLCVHCNVPFIANGRQKRCHDCAEHRIKETWGEVAARRAADPVRRERKNAQGRAAHKRRMGNDPKYRERMKQTANRAYRRLRQRLRADPVLWLKWFIRERARKDTWYAEHQVLLQFLDNPKPLERAVLAQLEQLGFPASVLQERPQNVVTHRRRDQ